MKKWLATGGLVLVTIIWGGGLIASNLALNSLEPFQIMTIRFALGTIFMGLMSIRSFKGVQKEEIKAGALMGLALFLGFSFQIVGLQYTTPSKNAFLSSLYVVMVPFIAFFLLKKKIGKNELIGAVLSVVGVAILSLNGNLSLSLGDSLTLVCAVGFAFQIFFTGEFVRKYRATVLNFI